MVKTMKFDIMGMAKAGGAMGAFFVAFMWLGMKIGWGMKLAELMQGLYLGFDASALGLAVGLVWGVLDVGIGAAIFAWVYNKVTQ